MKKFLVSLDFSSVTDDVLDSAIDFARAFKGELTLLHVLPDFAITPGSEELAREQLKECSAKVAQAGLTCTIVLAMGNPAKMIAEEAKRLEIDYILMGSHGHGKLYSVVVGTTAEGVLKRAACGVILLPPETRAYD